MTGHSFLTNPALSVICFGGKGGVGKTTSAAATALYLADTRPQKRILLASIDPAHSLIDSLKGVTNDLKNLTVWEIDADVSFQKFIEGHGNALKKIIDRGTFLDEKDLSDFFSLSLPGIDELMGMIELVDLIEKDAYDVIVLDTAPTGHTIKFLQMPQLVRQWTNVLDLMMEKHRYMSKLYLRSYKPDDADAFIEAFSSGAKKVECVLRNKSCEFIPVMLPEAPSVNETKRFLSILKKHKIPVHNVIINRVYSVSDCAFCNAQDSLQKKYIDEMKRCFNEYSFLFMPLFKDEVQGREPLRKFAQIMAEASRQDYSLGVRPFQDAGHEGRCNDLVQQGAMHTSEIFSSAQNDMLEAGKSEHLFVPAKDDGTPPKSPLAPFPQGEGEGINRVGFYNLSLENEYFNSTVRKGNERGIFDETNRFPIPKSTIEFMLFSGKGGVGKTTIASATALLLSDLYPTRRILLFSTDPAHSLSDCLDVVIGDEVLPLKKNLYVQEMDAEKEYQKLKHSYSEEIQGFLAAFMKKEATINVVFEKEIIESLIDLAPPGIDEVMAVTKIIDYMDKGSFDMFILDTAPTGHLIRFLEMPELVLDWLRFFFSLFLKYKNIFRMPKFSAFLVDLSKKIKKLVTLLRDDERALFVPIAIPTEMAYEETTDLVNAVKNLKIPIAQVILNMVHPALRRNAARGSCPVCINRMTYEEKMFHAFKRQFPMESLCVVHKQEEEMIGMRALELLGKELYGEVLQKTT